MPRTVAYPTLKEVEDCTSVERCLEWHRFLPSPQNEEQVAVINAEVAKLAELRKADPAAFTRASKNLGWE